MKIRLITFTLLVFTAFTVKSQIITLNGLITDSKSNTPIPYVHVYIENTSFGTTSNADGKYAFNIPAQYHGRKVIFSAMGFKSYKLDLKKIKKTSTEHIKLKETSVMLQDIVVTAQSPKDIWKRAVKAHSSLFNTPKNRMQAFYRTTYQEDGYFTRLLEAAVHVHGGGKSTDRAQIEYLHMRKSEDLRKHIWKTYDGYMEHLVNNHPIRWRPGFLTNLGIKRYEFTFKDQVLQDDELFYLIHAKGPARGMHDVDMLIRARDYAIFGIKLYWHPENSDNFSWAWEPKEMQTFISDWQESDYEYQEYNGKMYLKRSRWHRKGMVIDDSTWLPIFKTESIDELLITNIEEGNFEQQHIIPVQTTDVYDLANYFPYDSLFWQTYNRPVDSEYFKNAKTKMEQFLPLDEQFQANTGLEVRK